MALQILVSAQLTGQEAVVWGWDWAAVAAMPQVWISPLSYLCFKHTWESLAPGSLKKKPKTKKTKKTQKPKHMQRFVPNVTANYETKENSSARDYSK